MPPPNSETWRRHCAQAALDAEFGLSFYDPYVSEPSLDLSPYLEDIDLDTSQQADIFDLVSTVLPKQDLKATTQYRLLFSRILIG